MQKHIERVNYTLRIYYTAARAVQPLFDLSGPRFPTRLADTWDTENNLRVASSRTAAVNRQVFTERFNILTIVLTGMSLIIAAVGSLGLTDSLTISGMERRREIGLMRAIGGSDRAVLQIFQLEGITIGALSWGLAPLLSQPISRLMAYQLGLMFLGVPLNYLLATWGAILWLAIALGLSSLASLLPSRKATHLKIREVLAYEQVDKGGLLAIQDQIAAALRLDPAGERAVKYRSTDCR